MVDVYQRMLESNANKYPIQCDITRNPIVSFSLSPNLIHPSKRESLNWRASEPCLMEQTDRERHHHPTSSLAAQYTQGEGRERGSSQSKAAICQHEKKDVHIPFFRAAWQSRRKDTEPFCSFFLPIGYKLYILFFYISNMSV